jgi:tetratricopeptide (TPR) repeat protein
VWMRRVYPVAPFGVGLFFAVLAPSTILNALREGMAEPRVYLATAGVFITVAAIVRVWSERMSLPVWATRTAVVLLVAILGLLTVRRNQVWSSPITLWAEAAVRAEEMWEPHYALADSLREGGRCDAAISEYQKVVGLRPAHRDAQTNLGICLAQTGQLEAAERAFREALTIDPTFARGYTNLGALALLAGDTAQARDFYLQALRLDRANVLARLQLASLYEHTFHDYHAAARMCGEARLLAPATPGVVECVERNQRLASGQDR